MEPLIKIDGNFDISVTYVHETSHAKLTLTNVNSAKAVVARLRHKDDFYPEFDTDIPHYRSHGFSTDMWMDPHSDKKVKLITMIVWEPFSAKVAQTLHKDLQDKATTIWPDHQGWFADCFADWEKVEKDRASGELDIPKIHEAKSAAYSPYLRDADELEYSIKPKSTPKEPPVTRFKVTSHVDPDNEAWVDRVDTEPAKVDIYSDQVYTVDGQAFEIDEPPDK